MTSPTDLNISGLSLSDNHEDLSQPDSGDLPSIQPGKTTILAARANARTLAYNKSPAAHKRRRVQKHAPPIKLSTYSIKDTRVASTGWIGLRDDGVSEQEAEAGVCEEGWQPTHKLPDFFGKHAKFHGFRLEKYLGPCVLFSRI